MHLECAVVCRHSSDCAPLLAPRIQSRRSVLRRQCMLHVVQFLIVPPASAESHVAVRKKVVNPFRMSRSPLCHWMVENDFHTELFHVFNSDVISCMFCSYALFRTAVSSGSVPRLSDMSVVHPVLQVGCAQPPAGTPLECKRQQCYHIGSAALSKTFRDLE